jgi:hypothetical protein
MLRAKSLLTPALAVVLAFGVTAPQASPEKSPAPAAADEKADTAKKKRRGSCAFRRNLNGFSVIDEKHFVLRSGTRSFLVTVSPGCRHLDFEMRIAIKSTPAAGLCVERGDRIIVNRFDTCWIRDIEPVENKAEAKKLVEERKKAAEETKEASSG